MRGGWMGVALCLMAGAIAVDRTFYVRSIGSSFVNSCGSLFLPCDSINTVFQVIQNTVLSDSDTVIVDVGSGRFEMCSVRVTSIRYLLNIRGAGASSTFITCSSLPTRISSSSGLEIAALSASSVHITGITFYNYTSASSGSILAFDYVFSFVSIINCVFKDSHSEQNGGCVSFRETRASVANSTFQNCSTDLFGGAIHTTSSASVLNSSFIENFSQKGGGALYLTPRDEFPTIIQESNFQNNKAGHGGAIAIFRRGQDIDIKVRTCNFSRNQAVVEGGGAIWDQEETQGGKFTIESSNFTENTAILTGGALGFRGLSVNVLDCVFSRHSSESGGSASCINCTSFLVESSLFSQSTAQSGGSIHVSGASALFNDCVFDSNSASLEGGAVFSSSQSTNVLHTNFTSNRASFGGALKILSFSSELDNCFFGLNKADTSGGAVLLAGFSPSSILESTISKCLFVDNEATSGCGGALFMNAFSSSHVSQSSFMSSFAQSGGTLCYFSSHGDHHTVESSLVQNSRSGNQGGSIYAFGPGDFAIRSLQICNSLADGFGGAVYSVSVHVLSIKSVNFENCVALSGGAVHFDGGTLSVENSQFQNCSVSSKFGCSSERSTYGTGAVFSFDTCSNVTLRDISFKNVSAESSGSWWHSYLPLKCSEPVTSNISSENDFSGSETRTSSAPASLRFDADSHLVADSFLKTTKDGFKVSLFPGESFGFAIEALDSLGNRVPSSAQLSILVTAKELESNLEILGTSQSKIVDGKARFLIHLARKSIKSSPMKVQLLIYSIPTTQSLLLNVNIKRCSFGDALTKSDSGLYICMTNYDFSKALHYSIISLELMFLLVGSGIIWRYPICRSVGLLSTERSSVHLIVSCVCIITSQFLLLAPRSSVVCHLEFFFLELGYLYGLYPMIVALDALRNFLKKQASSISIRNSFMSVETLWIHRASLLLPILPVLVQSCWWGLDPYSNECVSSHEDTFISLVYLFNVIVLVFGFFLGYRTSGVWSPFKERTFIITSISSCLCVFLFDWILEIVLENYVARQNLRFFVSIAFVLLVHINWFLHRFSIINCVRKQQALDMITTIQVSEAQASVIKTSGSSESDKLVKINKALEFLNGKKESMEGELLRIMDSITLSVKKLHKQEDENKSKDDQPALRSTIPMGTIINAPTEDDIISEALDVPEEVDAGGGEGETTQASDVTLP